MTDTGGDGRGGRRPPSKQTEPHALVRPYVLSTDSSTDRRPIQCDADGHRASVGRPALDWTGDLSRRPDGPATPKTATVPQPEVRSAGTHRAQVSGRNRRRAWWMAWSGLLDERRWLAAIGAASAVLVIAGGLTLYLSQSPAKRLANAPAPAHKANHRSHSRTTHSTVRHSPATTRTHPVRSPTRSSPAPASPRPTSTPTTSPTQTPAKVSYTVLRQHPHSFQGQFTIVNDGSTAINGWELVVVLPGDDVRSVSGASFHTNGDTLYIEPSGSQRSIAPGASVTEDFTAHGSTTTLAGCTFNGAAC